MKVMARFAIEWKTVWYMREEQAVAKSEENGRETAVGVKVCEKSQLVSTTQEQGRLTESGTLSIVHTSTPVEGSVDG